VPRGVSGRCWHGPAPLAGALDADRRSLSAGRHASAADPQPLRAHPGRSALGPVPRAVAATGAQVVWPQSSLPTAARHRTPVHRGRALRLATFELLKPPEALTPAHQTCVTQLGMRRPESQEVGAGRQSAGLPAWRAHAAQSPVSELRRFAPGLRQDEAAGTAAVQYAWSNGPVEGPINRLTMPKRQMFGRAHRALLRRRFLRTPHAEPAQRAAQGAAPGTRPTASYRPDTCCCGAAPRPATGRGSLGWYRPQGGTGCVPSTHDFLTRVPRRFMLYFSLDSHQKRPRT
jgi:hypothetical protein